MKKFLPDKLTQKKADFLLERDFKVSGYILTGKSGKVALIDRGKVRWISVSQLTDLLHSDQAEETS